MGKPFYITTTLPYVNAKPHIGTALEFVQTDAIARYKRSTGYEVIFNTGTDEHGAKIYERALEEHREPQSYCDEESKQFDALKEALNLSYDRFIRTTDPSHMKSAQEFWRICEKNGDIEKRNYKAKYCVGCELEKTDSELEDGKCPLHPNRKIELIDEENYFFKFSKYQDRLLKLYEENLDFVLPREKMKEIRTFVASGLKDFSISRLKQKMPWGIPVPGDDKHVMYVWFDALVNYISTLGWPENSKEFKQFWPGVQVAGKDNLRQQSAMWQAMLLSAGLPTSKQILIHGFITSEGRKMSKSLGNVVDPFGLVEKYGTDAVRYFLLAKVPTFGDADFTRNFFEKYYTADLANGLGNIVSRILALRKYQKTPTDDALGKTKTSEGKALFSDIREEMSAYQIDRALRVIWDYIRDTDKMVERAKPWEVAKKEPEKFHSILARLIARVNVLSEAVAPFLPETAKKIASAISGKTAVQLFPRLP